MSDAEMIMKFIATAYQILSARMLLILTLLLSFSLFSWAMYEPDYPRILTATIFAAIVFLPVRQLDAKKEHKNASGHQG